MEDLGFFPYPSMSFGSPFDDVIMDPGPTSFFLKESSGEDILLGQGLDQLQTKLGLDLFKEENNGSPINVDDDWLMKDLSGTNQIVCFSTDILTRKFFRLFLTIS